MIEMSEPNGALSHPLSHSASHASRRRRSMNSIEGQRGQMQVSHKTLHGKVGLRDRIHHFTLAWFTCTMSTGGIGILLAQTPNRFPGLTTLGTIVFILDISLFITFCALITTRFVLFPGSLQNALQHPTESLFFPTFWISIVNMLSGIQTYGVPNAGNWLIVTMRIFFWMYSACAFLEAVWQYFLLFKSKALTVQNMTPQWILPVFPIMLSGTLGSVVAQTQPVEAALPIVIAGTTFQGLGMMMAIFIYGPYISRLLTSGLPSPGTRPGMFIAVGPPSFTGFALLGLSDDVGRIYPNYGTISGISNPKDIADTFRIVAICVAVFLWAVAFWFFSISLVSVLHGALHVGGEKGMKFHLTWWAFVFPNVGFALCTISIGKVFVSQGIMWVGSAMTVLLVAMWLFVGFMHGRAVWRGDILWPGKDEDHDQ